MLATMPWLCVITSLRKGTCRYFCPASEHALPASISGDRDARRFFRDSSGRERPPGKVFGENIDADGREREEHACPKERRVLNLSPAALPLRPSNNVFAAECKNASRPDFLKGNTSVCVACIAVSCRPASSSEPDKGDQSFTSPMWPAGFRDHRLGTRQYCSVIAVQHWSANHLQPSTQPPVYATTQY
jgi:hypothetical protein